MKKLIYFVTILSSLILIYGIAIAGENGNGLPPGPRYMLNVIAFDNCPAGDFTDSNRHMIAVQADYGTIGTDTTSTQAGTLYKDMIRTNTISLTMTPPELGNVFQVIDGNACGTDKGGAQFMLPADPYDCGTGITNDPNCTGEDLNFQEYKVFVRLVGKPKTKIGVTTCAVDPVDPLNPDPNVDPIVCSTENVIKVRSTGKGAMRFEDVSRELLTICLDTTLPEPDGTCDVRYALFDPALYAYFWQWNTEGKAHAQIVFIPIPD